MGIRSGEHESPRSSPGSSGKDGPELTLFAVPKPFHGHIATIQRNAIRSWLALRPACDVLLLGDEEGTDEVAAEFEVRHVREVQRSEFGTPLVSSLFQAAESEARSDLLCYVNCDVILMEDFLSAVRVVSGKLRRFLMVGHRWDLPLMDPLNLSTGWQEAVRASVASGGRLHSSRGMDYFVYPRGLFGEIPPFAVGRPAWDNWMLYRARSLGIPLIDATPAVMAVHQSHEYSQQPGGKQGVREGEEARRNAELAGSLARLFTLRYATHRLTPSGLKLALNHRYVLQNLAAPLLLHPWPPLLKTAKALYPLSGPFRAVLRKLEWL